MLSTEEFLQRFVCKKGELLEKSKEPMRWYIVKQSTRRYRKIAVITAADKWSGEPDDLLKQFKLNPKTIKKLPFNEDLLLEWVRKGWLIRDVRFDKDERTPVKENFRMGPGLYALEEEKQQKKNQEIHQNFINTYSFLKSSTETPVEGFPVIFHERVRAFAKKAEQPLFFTERISNFQLKLAAFLSGLYKLRRKQSYVDFKEIGATLYNKIGGSKVFDRQREDILSTLETWAEAPVSSLGLVSLGRLIPVYFTGPLMGTYATYNYGSVHAVTDLALGIDDFCTSASTLWLVENRAVLTRMAIETSFLQKSNSFVLAVDGHVRSAHRSLITQLCKSNIKEVIIWTDADPDGMQISHTLVSIINSIPFKIIGGKRVFYSLKTYDAWFQEETKDHYFEQEQQLGGVLIWEKWMNQKNL
ncbi:toprim domain-containing protein [Bacillus sp. NEB1478]|uniref:toprim domain-containing protein n=1 Tax=Bacillus sp. NEB1478 TaxID=3073816 RepID=UPI002872D3B0|nr:toprim domain-containing protein [Bacillus sp. NEB1478]WNB92117.1 toprim domain-containing protein [Bacillus sp. NEB1478]